MTAAQVNSPQISAEKKTGGRPDNVLGPARKQVRQDLYCDMLTLFDGQSRVDKSDPDHQMTNQSIPPRKACAEKILQHDLQKRRYDHGRKQPGNKGLLHARDPIIDTVPQLHGFRPCR